MTVQPDYENPWPVEIQLLTESKVLKIQFDDGQTFSLPFEYLRVYTPSAEAMGHGPGQEVLQTGKEKVQITAIEPVGRYAIKPIFSDGHNTGIYRFGYLYQLGAEYAVLWPMYLAKLAEAGIQRAE
ncbi:MAG: DUF971 domain-containing protein [Methylococcales bacterium]|nr:DUF971 domain-containing protein [Methylococcales bacterium]